MPKVMAIKTMLKCAKKCNDDCGQIKLKSQSDCCLVEKSILLKTKKVF